MMTLLSAIDQVEDKVVTILEMISHKRRDRQAISEGECMAEYGCGGHPFAQNTSVILESI
jgi:hypothetical protein